MPSNIEDEVKKLFGSSMDALQVKTRNFVERYKNLKTKEEKMNAFTMHLLDMQGWCP